MKKIINIASVLFFLSFNLCFAQKQNLDSLIQNINNKDAYIVLVKTMSPRIHGDSAKRILGIGKQATPELIKVLDNKNKGVIAHFILSEIWKDKWDEEICCDIRNIDNEEIIIINGLEVHIKHNILFSTIESLNKNMQNWKNFWHA